MDKSPLSSLYNDLKAKTETPSRSPMMAGTPLVQVPTVGSMPGAQLQNNKTSWRNAAVKEAEKLKETFCRTLLVKVYCDVCPLDNEWKGQNQETLAGDVDRFLGDKNMSAVQYLTSAQEKTKAPMLEMVLRAAETLRNNFMEEADATLRDAQNNELDVPPPQVGAEEEQETEDMLVDVEKDASYEGFIEELKRKTKTRIVEDITEEINKGKEKQDMTFDLKPDLDGGAPVDPMADPFGGAPMEDPGLEAPAPAPPPAEPAPAAPETPPAEPPADEATPPTMERAEVSVQNNDGADPDAPGKKSYKERVPRHKKSFKTDAKTPEDVHPKPKKSIPKTESPFLLNMDYITQRFIKEGFEIPQYGYENNPIMALAIRESALNDIDVVFKQVNPELNPYRSRLNFGKAILIKENVVDHLICESGETPLGMSDSKKFREKFPGTTGVKCVKSSDGKFLLKGSQNRSSDAYDSIDNIPQDAIRAVLN